MKRFALSFVLLLLSPLSLAVPIHGPHVHGTLAVAVVKQEAFLTFNMVLPSQDILGFEGSPVLPAQKKTLNDQYAKLYEEKGLAKLFQFEPVGACVPYSSNMDSEMLTYHEHEEEDLKSDGDKDTHSVGDATGHSDFGLTYTFECAQLERFRLSFDDVFPSIKKVEFYADGAFEGEPVLSLNAAQASVVAN